VAPAAVPVAAALVRRGVTKAWMWISTLGPRPGIPKPLGGRAGMAMSWRKAVSGEGVRDRAPLRSRVAGLPVRGRLVLVLPVTRIQIIPQTTFRLLFLIPALKRTLQLWPCLRPQPPAGPLVAPAAHGPLPGSTRAVQGQPARAHTGQAVGPRPQQPHGGSAYDPASTPWTARSHTDSTQNMEII
jgi:hypothetical protein